MIKLSIDAKVPAYGQGLSWCNKLARWQSPGGQKSMCFEATGRLQGRASKLLRARRESRCNEDMGQICLAANLFVEVVKLLEVYRFGWVVLCFVVFEVIDLFIPCFMSWQNQSMPCSLLHQHDEWLLNICFLPIPISINPCFPMKKQIRLTCLK
jgi:hypothetical protein